MSVPSGPAFDLPPPRKRRVWRILVAIAVIVGAILLLLRACATSQPQSVTIVAAGDMGCDPKDPGVGTVARCRAQAVSDLAVEMDPYAFIGLGDYLYEIPTTQGYNDVYGPSWGRLRDISFPVLGNQEYKVHEANTFRTYFGDRAGPEQGYYSVQLGQWHVVMLNSNCTVVVGGCGEGSPQQLWLEQDLSDSDVKCTMAVWHHPRWSNGIAGSDARLTAMYKTLLDHNVDVLLSAHEANYERFDTLGANGKPDPTGVRQFVVGTGGQVIYDPEVGDAAWRAKSKPIRSQFFDVDNHGVLRLTLNPDSYSWAFVTLDSGVVDAGDAACH